MNEPATTMRMGQTPSERTSRGGDCTSLRARGRISGLPHPGAGGRWPVMPEQYILAKRMTHTAIHESYPAQNVLAAAWIERKGPSLFLRGWSRRKIMSSERGEFPPSRSMQPSPCPV
ncbi:hypothetical protein TRIP_B280002 [uncultured Desulfatiglans sp.]|uniref:Uncharacterized protein n=1 Tax=Uncultured Desulfatiglans sp. TaxID=1748965 RepID=A0A653A670_UNCDX|nr:hypothetical protein TRIP_B280002 [uncultured Desulfatiglans sp.]